MKCEQITALLKRRIDKGVYSSGGLPGAVALAEEIGCSHITVRNAIKLLQAEGLVSRPQNGRVQVIDNKGMYSCRVAYVRPSWELNRWDHLIFQYIKEYECKLELVYFAHDDDPAITEAITGDYDLVLLNYTVHSSLLMELILKNRDKVVTLYHDFTDQGVRCLDGIALDAVSALMAHLKNLGHREILCFNTSPNTVSMQNRVRLWLEALEALGLKGSLHSRGVKSFCLPAQQALDEMNELLDEQELSATAIYCPDVETAIGVKRSLYEHNIRVPEAISLCTFASQEKALIQVPAITTIWSPDTHSEIPALLAYYARGEGNPDRLMYRPESKYRITGETVGEALLKTGY